MDISFIVTLALTVLILLVPLWVRFSVFKNDDYSHELQNIATSAGIFCTFVGIAYGLWSFDVGNIDNAVPKLLAGMKFAFFTSIAGLASSLVLKGVEIFNRNKKAQQQQETSEDTMGDILQEIKIMNKNIIGEGDSSIVTQIQKMRTNIVDKQDELNHQFKNFAEEMAKNNIDALTEVIEKVM